MKFLLILYSLGILFIVGIFWGQSRYDQLTEKSLMGNRSITQGISFEQILPYEANASLLERTFVSSVNWCYTNYKGMLFGILLAAMIFGLFSFRKFKPAKSPLWNAVQGFLMGIPLGVCVNCAAPIAQGMVRSKFKPETSLIMMFTSPSMNILVLSMLFTLLPLHLGLVKVIFTFFFWGLFTFYLKRCLFCKGVQAYNPPQRIP